MAGIGKYKKGAKFTLKSGNSPIFKMVGSSPIMHYVNDVPEHNDGHPDDLQTPEEHKAWREKKGKPTEQSPLTQKQKQVKLSKEEAKKGVIMTGGSKSEEAVDLEDRIEFLNNDISEESSLIKKGKMITQRDKLKSKLKKMGF